MTPVLSIIVPILNESRYLPRLLASLAGFGDDIEIIFSDGGSTDGSQAMIRTASKVRLLASRRGRATQMNMGAAAARAPQLFFLHGDTLPPRNTPQLIAAALDDATVLAGSFRLAFDGQKLPLRFYSWCSRANSLLTTFGDQGLFIRRASFEQFGGFADLPFLEDIEFQRRLRLRGKVVKLQTALTTSSRRFEQYGALRQQVRNIVIVGAYLAGVSPVRLKRLYSDAR